MKLEVHKTPLRKQVRPNKKAKARKFITTCSGKKNLLLTTVCKKWDKEHNNFKRG